MNLSDEEQKNLFANRHRYRTHRDGIIMFAREVMQCNPDRQQRKALRAYRKTGRIAVKSGHGTGKTVFLVILLFHHLFCYTNSMIIPTAPTERQIYGVLWREAKRWMVKSPILESLFAWTKTTIHARDPLYADIWIAEGAVSSNPDSLPGRHEKNMLFLLDEAPSIKEAAFPIIMGAITQPGNKVAMVGNPTKITGFFRSVFMKPQGWETMTFSCLESDQVDPSYAVSMAARFGVDSNIYRVRVLGQFPTGEDNTILPFDLVEGAQNRIESGMTDNLRWGGMDVANTGKNKTVIYARHGYQIKGSLELDCASSDDDVTAMNINAAIRMIRKYDLEGINIDKGGYGKAIFDGVRSAVARLRIDCQVIGVDNGGAANDSGIYYNAGTEMYFNLQQFLKDAVIPDNEDLFLGLVCRKYEEKDGKLWMIGKKAMMEAAKKEDVPTFKYLDYADALALCCWVMGREVIKQKIKVIQSRSDW